MEYNHHIIICYICIYHFSNCQKEIYIHIFTIVCVIIFDTKYIHNIYNTSVQAAYNFNAIIMYIHKYMDDVKNTCYKWSPAPFFWLAYKVK